MTALLLLVVSLLLTLPAWSEHQKEVLYLFGEGRAEYDSIRGRTNFILGDTDILGILSTGRFNALLEIYIEQPEPVVDVERGYFEWSPSRSVFIKIGKFHTPMGYFNKKWHHGLYLMTPIDRPHIVNFEDEAGPLPFHSVGIELESHRRFGGLSAGFSIAVTNGNLHLGSSNSEDFDNLKSLFGKVYVRPDAFSEIGINGGYDPVDVNDPDVGPVKAKNTIIGFHAARRVPGGYEAVLELYYQREGYSGGWGSGGFLLLSYPLFKSMIMGTIRPYTVISFLDWSPDNLWFTALSQKFARTLQPEEARNLNRHVTYSAGIKAVPDPLFSIKLEFSYEDSKDLKDYWSVRLSAGFGIPFLR